MTDTLPTVGTRNGPQSSTLDATVLPHLRRHISYLEQKLSDLSTKQNVDLAVTAAIGTLIECQRTLRDVRRCVNELNARYGPSLVVALDVDAVIQWCIAVRLQLDEAFRALVSTNEEAPLMS